ncbi:ferritin-like domain-containing protein [Noviherbaspirillum massiliense]|uniref:ferritin-like domain-containing protein n=1 Tax=Noviherbaspirillum massiliense TaxID=1465823 RepID=UPI00031F56F8|nr:ferritin-like domain-containing protein [Noviherbaspirillum massiliense]
MKETPSIGMNRTGVQMSPFDIDDMTQASSSAATPSPAGDASAMAALRSSYINEADPLGTVPVPGTVKGMLKSGASMMTGHAPQLLLDKLGERLAFERTGARLYDALITKVAALEQEGTMTIPGERLLHIREEEVRHAAMVADAIRTLGGDPTSMTPCADVVGVESMGLLQVVTDARTSVAQSLHAILVAEMTDNHGWEGLITLAEAQNHDQMAADFRAALEAERSHLQQVETWFNEATLGSAAETEAGTSQPSVH